MPPKQDSRHVLTQEHVAQALAEQDGLGSSQAMQDAVDAIIHAMQHALFSGDAIEIRGFGRFVCRDRAGQTLRDPRNNQPVKVGPRRVVRFKPSKKAIEAINMRR